LPPYTLTEKGHGSGGGENGKAVGKKITDPLLKVGNASVKRDSKVEEFGPISSNVLKYREGNASRQEERSPVINGLSQALLRVAARKYRQ
jgi:hypothetical protein